MLLNYFHLVMGLCTTIVCGCLYRFAAKLCSVLLNKLLHVMGIFRRNAHFEMNGFMPFSIELSNICFASNVIEAISLKTSVPMKLIHIKIGSIKFDWNFTLFLIEKPRVEISGCDIMLEYTPKSSWSVDEEVRVGIIKQLIDAKIGCVNKYCSLIEQFSNDQRLNRTVGDFVDGVISIFFIIVVNNLDIRICDSVSDMPSTLGIHLDHVTIGNNSNKDDNSDIINSFSIAGGRLLLYIDGKTAEYSKITDESISLFTFVDESFRHIVLDMNKFDICVTTPAIFGVLLQPKLESDDTIVAPCRQFSKVAKLQIGFGHTILSIHEKYTQLLVHSNLKIFGDWGAWKSVIASSVMHSERVPTGQEVNSYAQWMVECEQIKAGTGKYTFPSKLVSWSKLKLRAAHLEQQMNRLEAQLTTSAIMSLRRIVHESKWNAIPHFANYMMDCLTKEALELSQSSDDAYRYSIFNGNNESVKLEYFSHHDVKDHILTQYLSKYTPIFADKWCSLEQLIVENIHFTNIAILIFDDSIPVEPAVEVSLPVSSLAAETSATSGFWRNSHAQYRNLVMSVAATNALLTCQVVLCAQPLLVVVTEAESMVESDSIQEFPAEDTTPYANRSSNRPEGSAIDANDTIVKSMENDNTQVVVGEDIQMDEDLDGLDSDWRVNEGYSSNSCKRNEDILNRTRGHSLAGLFPNVASQENLSSIPSENVKKISELQKQQIPEDDGRTVLTNAPHFVLATFVMNNISIFDERIVQSGTPRVAFTSSEFDAHTAKPNRTFGVSNSRRRHNSANKRVMQAHIYKEKHPDSGVFGCIFDGKAACETSKHVSSSKSKLLSVTHSSPSYNFRLGVSLLTNNEIHLEVGLGNCYFCANLVKSLLDGLAILSRSLVSQQAQLSSSEIEAEKDKVSKTLDASVANYWLLLQSSMEVSNTYANTTSVQERKLEFEIRENVNKIDYDGRQSTVHSFLLVKGMLLSVDVIVEHLDVILLSNARQINCNGQLLRLESSEICCSFKDSVESISVQSSQIEIVSCNLSPWNCHYNSPQAGGVDLGMRPSLCMSQFEHAKWRHRVSVQNHVNEAGEEPEGNGSHKALLGIYGFLAKYGVNVRYLKSDTNQCIIRKHIAYDDVTSSSQFTYPCQPFYRAETKVHDFIFNQYLKQREVLKLCRRIWPVDKPKHHKRRAAIQLSCPRILNTLRDSDASSLFDIINPTIVVTVDHHSQERKTSLHSPYSDEAVCSFEFLFTAQEPAFSSTFSIFLYDTAFGVSKLIGFSSLPLTATQDSIPITLTPSNGRSMVELIMSVEVSEPVVQLSIFRYSMSKEPFVLDAANRNPDLNGTKLNEKYHLRVFVDISDCVGVGHSSGNPILRTFCSSPRTLDQIEVLYAGFGEHIVRGSMVATDYFYFPYVASHNSFSITIDLCQESALGDLVLGSAVVEKNDSEICMKGDDAMMHIVELRDNNNVVVSEVQYCVNWWTKHEFNEDETVQTDDRLAQNLSETTLPRDMMELTESPVDMSNLSVSIDRNMSMRDYYDIENDCDAEEDLEEMLTATESHSFYPTEHKFENEVDSMLILIDTNISVELAKLCVAADVEKLELCMQVLDCLGKSFKTDEVAEVTLVQSPEETKPIDVIEAVDHTVKRLGFLSPRCQDFASSQFSELIIAKQDRLSELFLRKSSNVDDKISLFWKILFQITGVNYEISFAGHQDKYSPDTDAAASLDNHFKQMHNLLELQNLLVVGFHNYYFALDSWEYIIVPKWFNIPIPRCLHTKSHSICKPMRCPAGVGSRVFVDDTNCFITSIDEPFNSLTFGGLRTNTADYKYGGEKVLTFELPASCMVFLCLDSRCLDKIPLWVKENHFRQTKCKITTSTSITFILFSRKLVSTGLRSTKSPGNEHKISLGGLKECNRRCANYFLLFSSIADFEFCNSFKRSGGNSSLRKHQGNRVRALALNLRWQLSASKPLDQYYALKQKYPFVFSNSLGEQHVERLRAVTSETGGETGLFKSSFSRVMTNDEGESERLPVAHNIVRNVNCFVKLNLLQVIVSKPSAVVNDVHSPSINLLDLSISPFNVHIELVLRYDNLETVGMSWNTLINRSTEFLMTTDSTISAAHSNGVVNNNNNQNFRETRGHVLEPWRWNFEISKTIGENLVCLDMISNHQLVINMSTLFLKSILEVAAILGSLKPAKSSPSATVGDEFSTEIPFDSNCPRDGDNNSARRRQSSTLSPLLLFEDETPVDALNMTPKDDTTTLVLDNVLGCDLELYLYEVNIVTAYCYEKLSDEPESIIESEATPTFSYAKHNFVNSDDHIKVIIKKTEKLVLTLRGKQPDVISPHPPFAPYNDNLSTDELEHMSDWDVCEQMYFDIVVDGWESIGGVRINKRKSKVFCGLETASMQANVFKKKKKRTRTPYAICMEYAWKVLPCQYSSTASVSAASASNAVMDWIDQQYVSPNKGLSANDNCLSTPFSTTPFSGSPIGRGRAFSTISGSRGGSNQSTPRVERMQGKPSPSNTEMRVLLVSFSSNVTVSNSNCVGSSLLRLSVPYRFSAASKRKHLRYQRKMRGEGTIGTNKGGDDYVVIPPLEEISMPLGILRAGIVTYGQCMYCSSSNFTDKTSDIDEAEFGEFIDNKLELVTSAFSSNIISSLRRTKEMDLLSVSLTMGASDDSDYVDVSYDDLEDDDLSENRDSETGLAIEYHSWKLEFAPFCTFRNALPCRMRIQVCQAPVAFRDISELGMNAYDGSTEIFYLPGDYHTKEEEYLDSTVCSDKIIEMEENNWVPFATGSENDLIADYILLPGCDYELPVFRTDRAVYFRVQMAYNTDVWSHPCVISTVLISLRNRYNKHTPELLQWTSTAQRFVETEQKLNDMSCELIDDAQQQFSQYMNGMPHVYVERKYWNHNNHPADMNVTTLDDRRYVDFFSNYWIINKTGLLLRYSCSVEDKLIASATTQLERKGPIATQHVYTKNKCIDVSNVDSHFVADFSDTSCRSALRGNFITDNSSSEEEIPVLFSCPNGQLSIMPYGVVYDDPESGCTELSKENDLMFVYDLFIKNKGTVRLPHPVANKAVDYKYPSVRGLVTPCNLYCDDRRYVVTEWPKEFHQRKSISDCLVVQTANMDRFFSSKLIDVLNFKVSCNSFVYFMLDSRCRYPPTWLVQLGFKSIGQRLNCSNTASYQIYCRYYSAFSWVSLGGNFSGSVFTDNSLSGNKQTKCDDSTDGILMYSIFISRCVEGDVKTPCVHNVLLLSQPAFFASPTHYSLYPGISIGDPIYCDDDMGTIAIDTMPSIMRNLRNGLLGIRTCNQHRHVGQHQAYLSFELLQPSFVFVCIDTSSIEDDEHDALFANTSSYSWIMDLGFKRTAMTIRAGNYGMEYALFARLYDIETVTINGIYDDTNPPISNLFMLVADAFQWRNLQTSGLLSTPRFRSGVSQYEQTPERNRSLLINSFWGHTNAKTLDKASKKMKLLSPDFDSKGRVWSKPLTVNSSVTIGEWVTECGTMSYNIKKLPGFFCRTSAITLLPRFLVVNLLSVEIDVIPFSGECDLNVEKLSRLVPDRNLHYTSLLPEESCALYLFPHAGVAPVTKSASVKGQFHRCVTLQWRTPNRCGNGSAPTQSKVPLSPSGYYSRRISVEQMGEQYVWLYPPHSPNVPESEAPQPIVVCATVLTEHEGSCIVVRLSNGSKHIPHRLENRSPCVSLLVRQCCSSEPWIELPPLSWRSYVWYDYLLAQKSLEVGIKVSKGECNDECVGEAVIQYRIDDVGGLKDFQWHETVEQHGNHTGAPGDGGQMANGNDSADHLLLEFEHEHNLISSTLSSGSFRGEIYVDKSTRVVVFYECPLSYRNNNLTIHPVTRKVEEENVPQKAAEEKQLTKSDTYSNLAICVNLAGLSVYVSTDFDICCVSFEEFIFKYHGPSADIFLSLFHMQIDDLRRQALFKVIFAPTKSGVNSHLLNNDFESHYNFLELHFCGEAISGPCPISPTHLLLVELLMNEMSIHVDLDFVFGLSEVVSEISGLVSGDQDANSSAATVARLNSLTDAKKLFSYQLSDVISTSIVEQDHGSYSWMMQPFYLEKFHHSTVCINMEVFGGQKMKEKEKEGSVDQSMAIGFAVLGGPLFSFLVRVLSSIAHISPIFVFNEVTTPNYFGTFVLLGNQLAGAIIQQVVTQIYKIVGSLELLGNPLSIVEDMEIVLNECLVITMSELLGEVDTRGEGFRKLFISLINGSLFTVSKVSGKFSTLVKATIADGEAGDTVLELEPKAEESVEEGIAITTRLVRSKHIIVSSFRHGYEALMKNPKQGYAASGVLGAAKGVGTGIIGSIAHPLSGALDAVSCITDTTGTTGFDANSGAVPQGSSTAAKATVIGNVSQPIMQRTGIPTGHRVHGSRNDLSGDTGFKGFGSPSMERL